MTTISLDSGHAMACEHVETCEACGTLLPSGDSGMCPDCAVEAAADIDAVSAVRALEDAAAFFGKPNSPRSFRLWSLALNALASAMAEHFSDPGVK